jgi:hypothetical protein
MAKTEKPLPGSRGTQSRAVQEGKKLDFPKHVPAAVNAHITTLIEGDSWEPMGGQNP